MPNASHFCCPEWFMEACPANLLQKRERFWTRRIAREETAGSIDAP